jgi:hypothetical protein
MQESVTPQITCSIFTSLHYRADQKLSLATGARTRRMGNLSAELARRKRSTDDLGWMVVVSTDIIDLSAQAASVCLLDRNWMTGE